MGTEVQKEERGNESQVVGNTETETHTQGMESVTARRKVGRQKMKGGGKGKT